MECFHYLGYKGLIWIFIGIFLLLKKKWRFYGVSMIVAVLLSYILGEKVIKEMDVDADKVVKLKENLSSIEAELEVKKENLEKLKPEYSEVLNSNQGYKAIIKEVDEGTEQLKNMMDR